MQYQYSETEFSQLMEEVEKEFTSFLGKTEAGLAKSEEESAAPSVDGVTLAKAEDEKPEPKEKEEKKDDKKPEAKADEAPAAESDAPAAEAKDAPAEAPAADEAAAPAAAEEPAAGGVYDAEDIAHMKEMYGSMSREELMAHHDAVKECLDAMSAAEAPAAAAPAAPGAEAPAADAPAAPAADAPAAPTDELPFAKSEGLAEVELLKSEILGKDSKISDLQKNLDAVTEILTKLVSKTAPKAKAITNVDVIAKSEAPVSEKTWTKAEITAVLNTKAADQSLSKSDRDAINSYYGSGQVNISKISHLLK